MNTLLIGQRGLMIITVPIFCDRILERYVDILQLLTKKFDSTNR